MSYRPVIVLIFLFSSLIGYCQTDQWQSTALPTSEEKFISLHIDSLNQLLQLLSNKNTQILYNGYVFKPVESDIYDIDNNPVDSLTIGPISDKVIHNDKLFYATINNGIWIRDGQRLQQFIIQDQFIPQNCLALTSKEGHLYILTTANQLYVWENDSYELIEYDIPKTEYISDITIDDWNQIWLLGEKNIFHKSYDQNRRAPKLSITDIQSSFESIKQPWTDLEFNAEELILSFASTTNYLPGETIQYQYKIKSDQWSPFSTNSNVNLTDLAPGEYQFQLRAKSNDSILGYSESINFTINQSFWSTSWPWLIGSITGLLLLWGFSYNNQRQALYNIQNSANKYRLENQLLKSQQEKQQLQMNPHFIFNSLNTIQGIVALGDTKKARHLLNQYAQLMRSLLNQSREDAITVEDEIQFLNRYLELEQAARNDKFDFNITCDQSLDTSINIPPMIVQPIVENAIVHGMKGIGYQGKIKIDITESSEGIQVVVDDNGVGRDASSSDHESHGLSILTERLQSYSTFKEITPIDTLDKMENGKPTGTTVTLCLSKLS